MICLFLATRYGDIVFDDVLVDVEEPLREYENLHGLLFSRDWSQPREIPTFYFTGSRTEWHREKSYKSRAERRLGKMQFGDGD